MKYKIDLHTHSVISPDGALTEAHYRRMLDQHRLNVIAVTDHNTIDMALRLREVLGEQIIVGEEITAREGEIIGLYLQESVSPHLTARETVAEIRRQGGLVYIPHPFETVRKGLTLEVLDKIADKVDIIEAYNGRAVFQDRSHQALAWAKKHKVPAAASSDAHGVTGWGATYTMLDELPSRDNLTELLRSASYQQGFPGIRGIMYPKFNRLRKWRKGK